MCTFLRQNIGVRTVFGPRPQKNFPGTFRANDPAPVLKVHVEIFFAVLNVGSRCQSCTENTHVCASMDFGQHFKRLEQQEHKNLSRKRFCGDSASCRHRWSWHDSPIWRTHAPPSMILVRTYKVQGQEHRPKLGRRGLCLQLAPCPRTTGREGP